MNIERWAGCYDAGWRDLIVPEAFAHPAKMSRALVARIFDALFASGALSRGAVVVDPFGGIGTTAIEGASRGVQVVCCELEPKFVALAQLNIDLHKRDWVAMHRPLPVIVNGDSRKLRQHIGRVVEYVVANPLPPGTRRQNNSVTDTAVDVVVASPPYAAAKAHPSLGHPENNRSGGDILDRCTTGARAGDERYGCTPGQLGDMREGSVDAVVSSPPWGEDATGHMSAKKWASPEAFLAAGRGNGCSDEARLRQLERDQQKTYGNSAGQLSAMPMAGGVDAIVSSPPFASGDSASAQSMTTRSDKFAEWVKKNCGSAATQGYGTSEGQLGVMPLGSVADAVVSSPPYSGEALRPGGIDSEKFEGKRGGPHSQARNKGYGTTEGQLGGLRNEETFWSAALDIVRESYAVLKPGGTAVWVVKMFVRDKQLVDFPGDWRKLCESVGFETVTEVHAMLVAEEVHTDLFDGPRIKRRERKSFFRRLAEKKGSPRIDHETVFFMVKPTDVAERRVR